MSSNKKITIVKDFYDLKINPYKGQDYEKLKKDCLDNKVLFEDSIFPPVQNSISGSGRSSLPFNVNWSRPNEIAKNPVFIDGSLSADDLGT